MKPKVYIETTVLSYITARPSTDPLTAERQAITRLWWRTERRSYELYASDIVVAECQRGDHSQAEERLKLVRETSLLPENKSILELTKKLLAPNGMPASAAADAAHVATATVHECDYLLTWNLRHIANATIRRSLKGSLSPMDTIEQRYVRQKNSSDRKPWEDEVLQEVYAGRDAHAAQFGNDATQIYKDLVKKGRSIRAKLRKKGKSGPA
jgi:hypothetical protein